MSRLAASRQAALPTGDPHLPRTAGARPDPAPIGDGAPDCERLWALCLEAARRRRAGLAGNGFIRAGTGDPAAGLAWHAGVGWRLEGAWSPQASRLFALHQP